MIFGTLKSWENLTWKSYTVVTLINHCQNLINSFFCGLQSAYFPNFTKSTHSFLTTLLTNAPANKQIGQTEINTPRQNNKTHLDHGISSSSLNRRFPCRCFCQIKLRHCTTAGPWWPRDRLLWIWCQAILYSAATGCKYNTVLQPIMGVESLNFKLALISMHILDQSCLQCFDAVCWAAVRAPGL